MIYIYLKEWKIEIKKVKSKRMIDDSDEESDTCTKLGKKKNKKRKNDEKMKNQAKRIIKKRSQLKKNTKKLQIILIIHQQ